MMHTHCHFSNTKGKVFSTASFFIYSYTSRALDMIFEQFAFSCPVSFGFTLKAIRKKNLAKDSILYLTVIITVFMCLVRL